MATTQPADQLTTAARLLELIGAATAADLAAIDQAIQAKRDAICAATNNLRAELKGLLTVRAAVAARLGVAAPKAKRAAPRAAAANGQPGADPRDLKPERRRQIARLLGGRGPLASSVICNELELPPGSMTALLDCDWFERTGQGFRLTATGRKEALGG